MSPMCWYRNGKSGRPAAEDPRSTPRNPPAGTPPARCSAGARRAEARHKTTTPRHHRGYIRPTTRTTRGEDGSRRSAASPTANTRDCPTTRSVASVRIFPPSDRGKRPRLRRFDFLSDGPAHDVELVETFFARLGPRQRGARGRERIGRRRRAHPRRPRADANRHPAGFQPSHRRFSLSRRGFRHDSRARGEEFHPRFSLRRAHSLGDDAGELDAAEPAAHDGERGFVRRRVRIRSEAFRLRVAKRPGESLRVLQGGERHGVVFGAGDGLDTRDGARADDEVVVRQAVPSARRTTPPASSPASGRTDATSPR